MSPQAIGPADVVSVKGKYLFKQDGTRFLMKGIAFPDQVIEKAYNSTAWIDVLHQLKSLELDYNTVRVYRMDPNTDYSEFFDSAASLGVYVIVPLTSAQGGGVLDRDKKAPKCYPRELFQYGVKCLQNYLKYPNVLAGLISNEVMNSLESWHAAPCVKAYGKDLKIYMMEKYDRSLPLIYAAQNSGIGSEIDEVSAMKMTSDYLTCRTRSSTVTSITSLSSIDMFGINVESWCSSLNSFEVDEDGKTGSYHSLWEGLKDTGIPLVFSEMGCSHLNFDHDNGLSENGTRDWGQVPVVLLDMSDVFSGFCAHAYDGNDQFNMFEGGPWKGEPLGPMDDFFNLRDQLKKVSTEKHVNASFHMGITDFKRPYCADIEKEFLFKCGKSLYGIDHMPKYSISHKSIYLVVFAALGAIIGSVILAWFVFRSQRNETSKLWTGRAVSYSSIN